MSPNFQIFSSLRHDPSLPSVFGTAPPETSWNHAAPSPLYMLDFHRDRMLRAATHWKWHSAIELLHGPAGLERLASAIHQEIAKDLNPHPGPLKVRVAISPDGTMDLTTAPVPETALGNLFPSHLPSPHSPDSTTTNDPHTPTRATPYEVVISPSGTPRSEFTHFKTTVREAYDAARQLADVSLTSKREVLLVNQADGSLMEGSTTTPYLWRGGRWVTPPVSRGFSAVDGSGGQDGTTRRWALERGVAEEDVIPVDSLVEGEECWLSNGVRGFFFGRIHLQ
ncbi:aminotransferase [Podospora conica]|nr:aminotransferase [Schizothecium conicum]